MCPAHCGGGEARRRWREKHATLDATCPPPPPAAPLVRSGPPPRCSDSAAQLTAAGVFLLVGVQSGPSERHLARRNAIRHSWIRWENVGRTVLVCFLLGRRELRPGALRRLEAEAAENGDVLWLTNATDEGVPTLKGYEWWRTAASLLPADSGGGGIAHFAKVDDDSFVHLINLEADLRRLWVRRRRRRAARRPPPARPPRPRLIPRPSVVAVRASAALRFDRVHRLRPVDLADVRLVVAAGRTQHRKEACARKGAHPPFPFMNGAMELLSAGLVRHVAASAEVDAFVARAKGAIEARKQAGHAMADRQRGPRVWRQNEDIALGFWIARAIRLGRFNVTCAAAAAPSRSPVRARVTPPPPPRLCRRADQRPRDQHGVHLDGGDVPAAAQRFGRRPLPQASGGRALRVGAPPRRRRPRRHQLHALRVARQLRGARGEPPVLSRP